MSFAYLPLFTGDYLRDTQHLSMTEHGAYIKLLMHCWDQKGPAPLDERKLYGICNARSKEEISAMLHILEEFFVKMDDGWYNRRLQREIEKTEAISRVRSTAGRKGFEARAKHLPSKSQASAKHVHLSPSPSPSLSLSPSQENTRKPSASMSSSLLEDDPELPKIRTYKVPDCPFDKLVEQYHQALPASPAVEVISPQRKDRMRARWRHVCAEEKLDLAGGLDWFAAYFSHAAKSPFLTGKVKPKDGKRPFVASLDFLMDPERFVNVFEGKYHAQA